MAGSKIGLSRLVVTTVIPIILGLTLSCSVKTTRRTIGSPDPIKIQDIRVAEGIDKTIIELESEEPILYTSFRLSDPDRLVIEMADVTFGQYEDKISVKEGPVRAITLSSSEVLDVSRLEFELNGLVKTDVRPEGLNIVIEVTRMEKASGPGKPQQVEARHKNGFVFFEEEERPPAKKAPARGLREEPLDAEMTLPPSPPPPAAETPTPLVVEKEAEKKEPVMTPPAQFVSDVKVVQGESLQLVVTSDGRLDPNIFFVGKKKDRLVIDLPGVKRKMKQAMIPGDELYVKRVRIGQHPKKLRLVLDLNQAVTFTWDQKQNKLWVTLK